MIPSSRKKHKEAEYKEMESQIKSRSRHFSEKKENNVRFTYLSTTFL